MPSSSTLPSLRAQVLRDAQSNSATARTAQKRLPELFQGLLLKFASRERLRYHLHADACDDVLQETYRLILDPGVARFDPARSKTPQSYLKGLVQNAGQKVAAFHGLRRRRVSNDTGAGDGRYKRVGPTGLCNQIPDDTDNQFLLSPVLGDQIEGEETVDFVLRKAPSEIRRAIRLQYWEGRPIRSIAEELGLSRFALGRMLKGFFKTMRQLLGCAQN